MPMKLEKINKPPRGASLRGVAVELSILYQKIAAAVGSDFYQRILQGVALPAIASSWLKSELESFLLSSACCHPVVSG